MPEVRLSAIMGKIWAYANTKACKDRMQAVVDEYKKSGVSKTAGGSVILTEDKMHAIAHELIEDLQNMANDLEMDGTLPRSVAAHFESLTASAIINDSDGSSHIEISFMDDLSRDSLISRFAAATPRRTGDGVDNIIALFDEGYSTKRVFGYWENGDVWTWSMSHRPYLGFMDETIEQFNMKYGDAVHATLLW